MLSTELVNVGLLLVAAPGDTRRKKLWVNLQRIVDKRGRIGKKRCGVTPCRGVTPK